MVAWKSSLILVWLILPAMAQDKAFPRFEDFPVKETFNGHPAQPILDTPGLRLYRTKIREAAAKGPDFAGYYAVASWGCGAGCQLGAVVDLKSGRTLALPYVMTAFPDYDFVEDPQAPLYLAYKIDSRLIVIKGCPGGPKGCASFYTEWTGAEFKLIRKIPAIFHPGR